MKVLNLKRKWKKSRSRQELDTFTLYRKLIHRQALGLFGDVFSVIYGKLQIASSLKDAEVDRKKKKGLDMTLQEGASSSGRAVQLADAYADKPTPTFH